MRFESRELVTYAKPVSAAALKIGQTYFSVTYVDEDMHVPIVEPLVFLGKNLRSSDESRLYFQDAESFHAGVAFDVDDDTEGEQPEHAANEDAPSDVKRALFYEVDEKDITNVFEFENALEELMKCSVRRDKTIQGQ